MAPVMKGATKPAIMPLVMISAMPAAAAAPDRKRAGIDQKHGSAEKIAQAAKVMTTIVASGEFMYSAAGMLNAPTTAGMPTCRAGEHRRVASGPRRNSSDSGW